jgi:hypothetical protein
LLADHHVATYLDLFANCQPQTLSQKNRCLPMQHPLN